ncbi:cytochrome c biogenesis protein CcsA [Litoribacter ruber]|uniref:cytochrome c biogenesis protein n=1 Tax=Litoribacter ruber TaxID=702568 RepID=UPI001BDA2578|nr:cytochrome c biogenesis protein CcsA [Litoribacter ruber]MBT0810345.1 cytochrome c biogenesis protein CcsA [Litoribacter ruber]
MRLVKLVFSTKVTLVLLIAFAGSMAWATFIENDHGTAVARGMVYDSWWFEIILIWLAFNFLGHIQHYKLFSAKRWPIGLFHIAFVITILGAGITRYMSEEGMIHIREGETGNTFYTTAHYLQVKNHNAEKGNSFEKPIALIGHKFRPQTHKVNFNEPNFKVTFEDYIIGGREEFEQGDQTYIGLAVAVGSGREDYLVNPGQTVKLGDFELGTTLEAESPVKVFKTDSSWMIHTNIHLQLMDMNTQQMGVMHAGETQPIRYRSLYQWDAGAFIVKSIEENAQLHYGPEPDPEVAKNRSDIIKLAIKDQDDNPISNAYFKLTSLKPNWHSFEHDGQEFSLTYGPKAISFPFELYLNAFELDRYPGSQSPASYASEVMVRDNGDEFPYRIFMNNVLDYRGYRFYQSSYDTDEMGTVLSVNQDRPGTYLTYFGYFLMTLGMFMTLFVKGSRFQMLNRKLVTLRKKAMVTLPLFLFAIAGLQAQTPVPTVAPESIVPKEVADEYGKLIVQDLDGRMKPLNTLANEIVRKVAGKSYVDIPTDAGTERLTAEQFLLAIQLDPVSYSHLPIIKIDSEKSLHAFAALDLEPTDRISFRDFLTDDGEYRLYELVEIANMLKPSERNESHKELLKTDERFNIFYALLTGDFLRIFPNQLDENNTWFTSQQHQQGFEEEDAIFVKNITPLFLNGVKKGLEQNNWEDAYEALNYINVFQQYAGKEVYPSENLIMAEVLYNRLNLGTRMFGPFWLIGLCMLMLGITMLFKENKPLHIAWSVGNVLGWIGLLVFTFHLGLRWYIAKHPPWSDGFEMLVFVAWGVLFFGLIFSDKSKFTVPLGLLFSGTLLFVGFLDWLNPEITNLMPVLHSYWLKIHVAVIVSGYAPLALSAIMALLSLMLLIFKPTAPKAKWWLSMQELNVVNEMSITIGLFLLTIGTFLGGVWANESWGRYWAWDPKETWALISIIIYAAILHLRLIPPLKNSLLYNLASLWGFSTIIMTSFGVNYYLSGLHSYAAGDPVPVPHWVYWIVAVLLVISVIAWMKYKKLGDDEKKRLVV